MENTCPCKSSKTYSQCCGIAHSDIKKVTSAEQLMRSRYSAFAMGNSNYLHISHHPSTRPASKKQRDENIQWANSVIWTDLEIVAKEKGQIENTDGIVEFKAFYLENGKLNVIHEKSNFVKENGIWLYVDGNYN